LRKQPEPFPRARIEVWEWAGTHIRVESQGIERNPESIQYRVVAEMKHRGFSVVFDDGQGESADVVGVIEHDDHLEVEFWHCKLATAAKPGYRIKELYELCGHRHKRAFVGWRSRGTCSRTSCAGNRVDIRDTRPHVTKSERRKICSEFARRLTANQCSSGCSSCSQASRKLRLRRSQLELLAVTENYLLETFAVPFRVVASR
jgi:hypothetical protein